MKRLEENETLTTIVNIGVEANKFNSYEELHYLQIYQKVLQYLLIRQKV